jgi:hypothetical protein
MVLGTALPDVSQLDADALRQLLITQHNELVTQHNEFQQKLLSRSSESVGGTGD